MTLRVLHVGKFYPPQVGGMEVFLADLVQTQREQGIEAAALVHGDPLPDDPPWLIRVPVQAQLIYAPLALGFRAALRRAIDTFAPDVLHLHMPNLSVFWVLTLPSAQAVPWVVHWHSDVVASRIRTLLRLAYYAYRPFEQAVLERSARIIATSPPYLQASEALQPWRDKCGIVPLGIRKHASAPTLTVDTSPWPQDALRLLAIGRLAYYKGFEDLIRAVAGQPGVALRIAGAGELQDTLQALIRELTPPGQTPNVQLLGSVSEDDKHGLLESCDVFCLPSIERTEAFGMVLLEAMAHAKPCIVSDLDGSGMPWVVDSAQSGLRVPVGDREAWRHAISTLRTDATLRERLGQQGQRALAERFDIAQCVLAGEREYRLATELPDRQRPTRDTLIVIPARDEVQTIGPLVRQLHAAGWMHVLVIDDQSQDGTGEAAQKAGAQVLRPVLGIGAWGGMQAGIRHAWRQGFQRVITMDADGQHEVDELPALLRASKDADVVIGAHPQRASRLRQLAWAWFRHLSGMDLHDLTSGFRCYNRDAIRVLAGDEATLLDYQDVGTLLMLHAANLRVVETPVAMNLRTVGASRIFNSWFSVGRYMAVTTLLCMSRWRVAARSRTVT